MSAQPNLVVVAEWRSMKTDEMEFPAQGGRPARKVARAIHSVEIEGCHFEFSEELPAGANPGEWKAPAKKGDMCTVGLFLEPANVATIVNNKAQVSRGLWRVRIVQIVPNKRSV